VAFAKPAGSRPAGHLCSKRFGHSVTFSLALTLCFCFCPPSFADPAHRPATTSDSKHDPADSAQKAYSQALSQHNKNPSDSEVAWQFARACFDLAEFSTNSAERAELAERGIAACRQIISQDPNSAPAHYYLGMNLGQLARTKGLGALKLVDQMEHEFTTARELDEHFDYAGPDRNLGLLYRDAPSVGSIGSRAKARKHLQRAAELAPEYPENGLNLIETCLRWSDRNGARRELKALEAAWPNARANLSGHTWTASWADWEQRLNKAKKKIEEASKAIESPRQRD